jgi:RsiW-degrading membrane proteinase PrsW (M82 family)
MANAPSLSQRELLSPGVWRRVFRNGFMLYALGLVVLILSGNPNIFPTVLMLGSFLVPATYVAFFYEHRHLSRLSMTTPALSFFYGGVLGLFSAALLEPIFISRLDFFTAFEVGLIEEFTKILGVLVIARRRRHDSMLDGLILGAAAGMGFAALESTGYAFTAFLRSGGSLTVTVGVTSILASVLFRESFPGRYRINQKAINAYFTVSILHGLWDGLPSLITALVGSGLDILLGQLLVAAVGLFILWRRWREARRLQEARVPIEGGVQ